MAIKNAILIVDPQSDFLQQTMFKGLVQVLGNEHVYTLPTTIEHFRGRVDDWYILPDGKMGMTAPPAHLKAEPDHVMNQQDIIDYIERFDLMVLCSPREYAMAGVRTLKELHRPLPALVILNGEDYAWSPIDEELKRKLDPIAYFKRELDHEMPGVYPLPFGAFIDAYPEVDDTQKRYSVYAAFGNTWPIRIELLKRLADMNLPDAYIATNQEHIPQGYEGRIQSLQSFEKYMRGMAQAKITFVIRGFGKDTLRAHEATAFETCVFWVDPGIIYPHPYEDRVHVVKLDESLTGMEGLIEYYLSHDYERQLIAQSGKAHCRQYHTTKARAEYVLEIAEAAISKKRVVHVNT